LLYDQNLKRHSLERNCRRFIRGFLLIHYPIRFDKEENLLELNKNIQSTFNTRKNMGIEEAILQEVKENTVQETKIKGIKKALNQKVLNIQQIADLFEVSIEFVLKVQKGEV